MPLVSAYYSEVSCSVNRFKPQAFIFQIQNRPYSCRLCRNKWTGTKRGKKEAYFYAVYFKRFLSPWPSCTTDRWHHTCFVKTWTSRGSYSSLSLRLCLWKRFQAWEPLLLFCNLKLILGLHSHVYKQILLMWSVHMQGVSSFLSSSHCLSAPTSKVTKALQCSYSLGTDS